MVAGYGNVSHKLFCDPSGTVSSTISRGFVMVNVVMILVVGWWSLCMVVVFVLLLVLVVVWDENRFLYQPTPRCITFD